MRTGPGLLPPGSDPGPAQPRARRGSAASTPPPAAPHPQATSHGSGSVPRRGPDLAPSPAVRPLTLHHKLRGCAELAGFARELGLVVRRTGDQYTSSREKVLPDFSRLPSCTRRGSWGGRGSVTVRES